MPRAHTPARRAAPARAPGTVQALLDTVYARLRRARLSYGHGTTNAWDEAVYLVLHALRLPPDRLTPVLAKAITVRECNRALRLAEQRIQLRIPAAYLTHEAWLGKLRFYVDRRVIVPRSYIAELLREQLAPWVSAPRRIKSALDLCTGSGCLAVMLAQAFPAALVDASDISRAALRVARRNLATYRLRRRVRLIESDLYSALAGQRYDLIISNPPYVSTRTMRRLPPEYLHEPKLALASGADGFDAVRKILSAASTHLTKRGLLLVEVGHHREELEAAFPRMPFVWLETSAGDDCVFMLARDELMAAFSEQACAQPLALQPPAASRRLRATLGTAASRRR